MTAVIFSDTVNYDIWTVLSLLLTSMYWTSSHNLLAKPSLIPCCDCWCLGPTWFHGIGCHNTELGWGEPQITAVVKCIDGCVTSLLAWYRVGCRPIANKWIIKSCRYLTLCIPGMLYDTRQLYWQDYFFVVVLRCLLLLRWLSSVLVVFQIHYGMCIFLLLLIDVGSWTNKIESHDTLGFHSTITTISQALLPAKGCNANLFSSYWLTHWCRDKMAANSQTTHSNAFSWMRMLEFR